MPVMNYKDLMRLIHSFFKAFQLSMEYSNNCSIAVVADNIAMHMYRQQQMDSAAVYFKRSFSYYQLCTVPAQHRNNKNQELFDNIGLCYTKTKHYDSALHYYRLALELIQKNKYNLAVDTANSLYR